MNVVCIKPHSQGILTVGKVYEVYGVMSCQCGMLKFNIGITTSVGTICHYCNRKTAPPIWWLDSPLFAPLEEKGEMFIEEFLVNQRTEPCERITNNITENIFLSTIK